MLDALSSRRDSHEHEDESGFATQRPPSVSKEPATAWSLGTSFPVPCCGRSHRIVAQQSCRYPSLLGGQSEDWRRPRRCPLQARRSQKQPHLNNPCRRKEESVFVNSRRKIRIFFGKWTQINLSCVYSLRVVIDPSNNDSPIGVRGGDRQ